MIWVPIVLLLLVTGFLAWRVYALELREKAQDEKIKNVLESVAFYDSFRQGVLEILQPPIEEVLHAEPDPSGDISITMRAFKNISQ